MKDNVSDLPNTVSVCGSTRNATNGFNSSYLLASLNGINKEMTILPSDNMVAVNFLFLIILQGFRF